MGSIWSGCIGNPANKDNGFSGLDKMKSTGIEILAVLIPCIGMPNSYLTKSISHCILLIEMSIAYF